MSKRRTTNNLRIGESWMETLSTLADPKAMEGLRRGEEDIRKGRIRSWQDIKRSMASRIGHRRDIYR
jgi:hypothetical protein